MTHLQEFVELFPADTAILQATDDLFHLADQLIVLVSDLSLAQSLDLVGIVFIGEDRAGQALHEFDRQKGVLHPTLKLTRLAEPTGVHVEVAQRVCPVPDELMADEVLGDGYKIDATEFRITAVAIDDGADGRFSFVLEQERTLISGDHVAEGNVPDDLPEKVKSYRIKSIAPGRGQYIDNASMVF